MMGMPRARYCVFEPFCLDVLDERLWKSDANIPLGYKAFCVLADLVGHPQQLVAKKRSPVSGLARCVGQRSRAHDGHA